MEAQIDVKSELRGRLLAELEQKGRVQIAACPGTLEQEVLEELHTEGHIVQENRDEHTVIYRESGQA